MFPSIARIEESGLRMDASSRGGESLLCSLQLALSWNSCEYSEGDDAAALRTAVALTLFSCATSLADGHLGGGSKTPRFTQEVLSYVWSWLDAALVALNRLRLP